MTNIPENTNIVNNVNTNVNTTEVEANEAGDTTEDTIETLTETPIPDEVATVTESNISLKLVQYDTC